jgi:hypothetical protein
VDGSAPSLAEIHAKLARKFSFEPPEYTENFSFPPDTKVRKVAIGGFEMSQRRKPVTAPGIELRSIRELMLEIASYARSKDVMYAAITKAFPLARMTQCLAYFRLLDSDSVRVQAR